MRTSLALVTRVAVAVLISLVLVTAAVTSFVISNPKDAITSVNDITPAGTSAP